MKIKKTNKLNRNTLSKQERLFNMKKLFLFVAALSVCALAADGSPDERLDGLAAQVDRVMSKAGIHFNGEFRSQFLNSTLDGDATADFGKKTESAEYTSVDFDIVARPNTALSARAMFRLHQDWRNFFSDVQNPIATRWLSIDGSLMKGIFSYNLGDYRKKLTPLTLWSPDLELLYEPEIFAQGRELAMSEVFLGGNNRVLQGGNLEFKAELGTESGATILRELYADVFGARLATRGSGESSPIAPGVATSANGLYWDAMYDKYLVGVNLAAQIIKGAGLGVSNISIFDNVDSYRGTGTPASSGINFPRDGFSDSAKYNSTSNNIFAGRLNLDNGAFMSDDFVHFGINGEAALSSYKYHSEYDTTRLKNSAGADSIVRTVGDRSIDGMAINAGLNLKFNFDEINTLSLSADYIQNDSAFINEAAQSPSFLQRAILNSENDLSGLGALNPFDAMYRSVFKYTPSQYFSESRPYTKNAYTNVIFKADKNGIAPLPANVFQAALPGGLATADRVGPIVKLDGSFLDKAISVGARAAMLTSASEVPSGNIIVGTVYDTLKDNTGSPIFNADGELQITKTDIKKSYSAYNNEYQEIIGGASFNIAKFAPVVGPSLVIGGSYGMYNTKSGDLGSGESVLLSGFLNYNFYTRFSLLFGYQQLTTSVKEWDVETVKYTFDNLAVGFGYKVADGGALTVKLTLLSGKAEPNGGTAVDYTATQPEVYLTVKF